MELASLALLSLTNVQESGTDMKLYDVPRNTFVKLPTGEAIDFKHIDGMYSLCCVPAGICHVKVWTEVEIVTKEDYFKYWKNK